MYIFIAIISFFLTIERNTIDTINNDVKELRISPQHAETKELTKLFESISYLPLQLIKGEEIDEISQLEITKNQYIILDKQQNVIFFFDKQGKFLNKISPNDQHINPKYVEIRSFSIDQKHDLLFFNDIGSQYLYKFKLDGTFLDVMEKTDFSVDQYVIYNEKVINYYNYSKSTNIILRDKENKKIISTILKFDTTLFDSEQDVFSLNKILHQSSLNESVLTLPYDYKSYSIGDNNELFEAIKFVFPINLSLPNDFLSNIIYKGNRFLFIKNNPSVIYCIKDVYFNKNWITLCLMSNVSINTYLYNTETMELYKLNNAPQISLGFELFHTNDILGIEDNKLISSVNSGLLKEIYKKSPLLKGSKLPNHMKRIFKEKKDTEILMFFTLK